MRFLKESVSASHSRTKASQTAYRAYTWFGDTTHTGRKHLLPRIIVRTNTTICFGRSATLTTRGSYSYIQAQPQKRVQHNNAQRRDTETTEASPVTDTPKWIEEVVQAQTKDTNLRLPNAFQCVVQVQNMPDNSHGVVSTDAFKQYLLRLLKEEDISARIPGSRKASFASGIAATALRRTGKFLSTPCNRDLEEAWHLLDDPNNKEMVRNIEELYNVGAEICRSISAKQSGRWKATLLSALLDALRNSNYPENGIAHVEMKVRQGGPLNNSTLMAAFRCLLAISEQSGQFDKIFDDRRLEHSSISNYATHLLEYARKKQPNMRISTGSWNLLLEIYTLHGFPSLQPTFGKVDVSVPLLDNASERNVDGSEIIDEETRWENIDNATSFPGHLPLAGFPTAKRGQKTGKSRKYADNTRWKYLFDELHWLDTTKRKQIRSCEEQNFYNERGRALLYKEGGIINQFPRLKLRNLSVWTLRGGFLLPALSSRYTRYALDGIVSSSVLSHISPAQLNVKWNDLPYAYRLSLHLSRTNAVDNPSAIAYANKIKQRIGNVSQRLKRRDVVAKNESSKLEHDVVVSHFDPWEASNNYGKAGDQPDTRGYNALIKLCTHAKDNKKEGHQHHVPMQPEDHGYRKDIFIEHSNDEARQFSNRKVVATIASIWREMDNGQVNPNGKTVKLSLEALFAATDTLSESVFYIERMSEERGLLCNEEALSAISRAYGLLKRPDKSIHALNKAVHRHGKWIESESLVGPGPLLSSWKDTLAERSLRRGSKRTESDPATWMISPRPFLSLMSVLALSHSTLQSCTFAFEHALHNGVTPTSKMLSIAGRSCSATPKTVARSLSSRKARQDVDVSEYIYDRIALLDQQFTLDDFYRWVIKTYRGHGDVRSGGHGSNGISTAQSLQSSGSYSSNTPVPIRAQLGLLRGLACTGRVDKIAEMLHTAVGHFSGTDADMSCLEGRGKEAMRSVPTTLFYGFVKAFAIAGSPDMANKLLQDYWEGNREKVKEHVFVHVIRNIRSMDQLEVLEDILKLMVTMGVLPTEKTQRALRDTCLQVAQDRNPVPATIARQYPRELKIVSSPDTEELPENPLGDALTKSTSTQQVCSSSDASLLERYSIFVNDDVRTLLEKNNFMSVHTSPNSHVLTKAVGTSQVIADEVIEFVYSQLLLSTNVDDEMTSEDKLSAVENGMEMLKLVLAEWPVSEKAAAWRKSKGNKSRERYALSQYLHNTNKETRNERLALQKNLWSTAKRIASTGHEETAISDDKTSRGHETKAGPWKSRVGYSLSSVDSSSPEKPYLSFLHGESSSAGSPLKNQQWYALSRMLDERLSARESIDSNFAPEIPRRERSWKSESGEKLNTKEEDHFVISSDNKKLGVHQLLMQDALEEVDTDFTSPASSSYTEKHY